MSNLKEQPSFRRTNEEREERIVDLMESSIGELYRKISEYYEHLSALQQNNGPMRPDVRDAQIASCEEDIELLQEAVKRKKT